MLENVQHLQPQPEGAWALNVASAILPGYRVVAPSDSCNLRGLRDIGSTQEFVRTRAPYLMQRSACFLHCSLPVQDSSLSFVAFPFSLKLSSYELHSFGYFSYILCPERMRGMGCCRVLFLLILFEGMTPHIILK